MSHPSRPRWVFDRDGTELMAKDKSLCVALTGASGFVGRHVLTRLLAAGHRVRLLARDPSRLPPMDSTVHVVRGGLFDPAAVDKLVRGADAVTHLVGIIRESPASGQTFERVHTEGTRRLADAATSAGVRRWVHMSALGTRPDAVSRYHRTKWEAERAVLAGGFATTIFRPSIIHGPDGEFIQMVKAFWCSRLNPPLFVPDPAFPFLRAAVPYFGAGVLGGAGAGRLQPVWVEDVADCMVRSLTLDQTIGEVYPMGGPEVYTWPQLYQTCRKHLKRARDKKVVALPVWLAMAISHLPGAPFNRDQVIMSQEDSVCQTAKVQQAFGVEPAPFEQTFAGYVDQV